MIIIEAVLAIWISAIITATIMWSYPGYRLSKYSEATLVVKVSVVAGLVLGAMCKIHIVIIDLFTVTENDEMVLLIASILDEA